LHRAGSETGAPPYQDFTRRTRPVRPRQSGAAETCFLQTTHYTVGMKNDVVPVQIRGILPANSGCALFVGNDQKVFVINVEPNMGAVIGMFLRDTPKERPLTHDLMQSIFKGFSITVERVVITELRNSTYFARLILQQQNELARKIVEIDARPSDCLALATAQKRPIYVTNALFEQVEDMSEVLDRINENGGETE
jgi:bifunctional DNase/RNase